MCDVLMELYLQKNKDNHFGVFTGTISVYKKCRLKIDRGHFIGAHSILLIKILIVVVSKGNLCS